MGAWLLGAEKIRADPTYELIPSGIPKTPGFGCSNTRGITMFVLDVSGIGCGSCITKITKAIQALDNEAKVLVDRAAGKVIVESSENPE